MPLRRTHRGYNAAGAILVPDEKFRKTSVGLRSTRRYCCDNHESQIIRGAAQRNRHDGFHYTRARASLDLRRIRLDSANHAERLADQGCLGKSAQLLLSRGEGCEEWRRGHMGM